MNRTVLAGVGAVLVVAGVVGMVGMGAAQARTEGAAAEATGSTGSPAWLHIRVDEHGKSSKVRVNVPLTVVEAALEAAPQRIVDKGRIKIDLGGHDDHDLSLAEMRRIWQELKDAGDTEIVSVEQEDETVKVARKGDLVQVRVQQAGRQGGGPRGRAREPGGRGAGGRRGLGGREGGHPRAAQRAAATSCA